MDLEPCTAKQFDVAMLSYACRPGWAYRIVHGIRCEGYLDGRLVLLIKRSGHCADHYMAPVQVGPPPMLPQSLSYK